MTVKTFNYHSLEAGISLAILGAVHGNERCGPEAIHRLISDLENGDVVLTRGSLMLMPIANPLAYTQNLRFIERNLNRSLYPKDTKIHYEDYLDPILCTFLDQADVLLDLHSFTSQGEPFIFLEDTDPEEARYARSLGVRNFVYGWSEAFGIEQQDKEAQGTVEYARSRGKIAVTLECGHHTHPHAPQVGYEAIIKSLLYFKMLDENCPAALSFKENEDEIQAFVADQRCIKMQKVYFHERDATLAKAWKHLDFISKDEPMAFLSEERAFIAPEDGYIILPKSHAKPGDEWFYFGTEAHFPASYSVSQAESVSAIAQLSSTIVASSNTL